MDKELRPPNISDYSIFTVLTIKYTEGFVTQLRCRAATAKTPAQSMWHLWWTGWYWDRFFLECFGFLLSVTFRRCPIFTRVSSRSWQMRPSAAVQFHRETVAPQLNNNNLSVLTTPCLPRSSHECTDCNVIKIVLRVLCQFT